MKINILICEPVAIHKLKIILEANTKNRMGEGVHFRSLNLGLNTFFLKNLILFNFQRCTVVVGKLSHIREKQIQKAGFLNYKIYCRKNFFNQKPSEAIELIVVRQTLIPLCPAPVYYIQSFQKNLI